MLDHINQSSTLQAVQKLLRPNSLARSQFYLQVKKGLEKYPTDIDDPSAPESYFDWLQHPFEEQIDLITYLQKVIALNDLDPNLKPVINLLIQTTLIQIDLLEKVILDERQRLPHLDNNVLPTILPST